MKIKKTLLMLMAISFLSTVSAADIYQQAVSKSSRLQQDTQLDAKREPTIALSFSGLKPG